MKFKLKLIDILKRVEYEYLKDYPMYSKGEVLKNIINDMNIEIDQKTNTIDFIDRPTEKKQTITPELLETPFYFRDFILFYKKKDGS